VDALHCIVAAQCSVNEPLVCCMEPWQKLTRKLSSMKIEVRLTVFWSETLILIFDLNLQSVETMVMIHTYAKGHLVQKLEWKRQTDRQTDGGDCITSHANVVGSQLIEIMCVWRAESVYCSLNIGVELLRHNCLCTAWWNKYFNEVVKILLPVCLASVKLQPYETINWYVQFCRDS